MARAECSKRHERTEAGLCNGTYLRAARLCWSPISPRGSLFSPRSVLRGDKRDDGHTHNRASLKSGLARRQPAAWFIAAKKHRGNGLLCHQRRRQLRRGASGCMGDAEGFEKNSKKKRASERVARKRGPLPNTQELGGSRGGKRRVKSWRGAADDPQNRKEIKKSRCNPDVELRTETFSAASHSAQSAALASSVPETLRDAFELILGPAHEQMLDLKEVLVLIRGGAAKGLHEL